MHTFVFYMLTANHFSIVSDKLIRFLDKISTEPLSTLY